MSGANIGSLANYMQASFTKTRHAVTACSRGVSAAYVTHVAYAAPSRALRALP